MRTAASHCFVRQRTDDWQLVSLTHVPELISATRARTLGTPKYAAPMSNGMKMSVQRAFSHMTTITIASRPSQAPRVCVA